MELDPHTREQMQFYEDELWPPLRAAEARLRRIAWELRALAVVGLLVGSYMLAVSGPVVRGVTAGFLVGLAFCHGRFEETNSHRRRAFETVEDLHREAAFALQVSD